MHFGGSERPIKRAQITSKQRSLSAKRWPCTRASEIVLAKRTSLVGLSEVLICQGRYSEAKPLLDEVAQLSNQIDYKWARNRSRQLLAEALEAEESSAGPSP
ncbi:hypothetical protein M407DRAFT_180038 [Tulasnella calospora MUT 4182]|uniref:MalT-like TPR region domain-containing protein n=1 Tax=Tulasnella calospora MUT 4182 TaxID=1051891 RepID=A0A0C3L5Z9_9AGAM|nr:hypothetical protein M407DRAFT_180038 [Tulasnella calospora MUT 4182]